MNPDWKLSDFNDKGQLRIPTGLVLVMVFLSRHLLLLLMGGVSRFVSAGAASTLAEIGLPPVWMLPINLPGLLLLGLALNRERLAAKAWWRRSMKWSIAVLQAMAGAQLLMLVLLKQQAILRLAPAVLVELLLLSVCLIYLVKAPKPRYFTAECQGGNNPGRD